MSNSASSVWNNCLTFIKDNIQTQAYKTWFLPIKPVKLSVLPGEMKKIQSTQEKKKLFIEIILPLILEENDRIKLDRIKLFTILNKNNNTRSEINWLNSKFKQYGVVKKDL